MRLKGINDSGFQRLAERIARPMDKAKELQLEVQDYEQGLHEDRDEQEALSDQEYYEQQIKEMETDWAWDTKRWQESEAESWADVDQLFEEEEAWRGRDRQKEDEEAEMWDMAQREPGALEYFDDEDNTPVPGPSMEEWLKRKRNQRQAQQFDQGPVQNLLNYLGIGEVADPTATLDSIVSGFNDDPASMQEVLDAIQFLPDDQRDPILDAIKSRPFGEMSLMVNEMGRG